MSACRSLWNRMSARPPSPLPSCAVAVNPWSAEFHERLAHYQLEGGNWSEALRQAGEAIRLNPFLIFARQFRIQCYLHDRNLRRAAEDVEDPHAPSTPTIAKPGNSGSRGNTEVRAQLIEGRGSMNWPFPVSIELISIKAGSKADRTPRASRSRTRRCRCLPELPQPDSAAPPEPKGSDARDGPVGIEGWGDGDLAEREHKLAGPADEPALASSGRGPGTRGG